QLKIFWRIFMRQISLTDYFCKGLGLCGLLEEGDERGEIKKSAVAVFLTCLIVGFYDGFFGPGTGTFSSLLCLSLINCRCCRLRLLPKFSILLLISGHLLPS
ncbi:TPA: hypothetical protein ACTCXB_001775, partial [Neisseria meningitidis]